MPGGSCSASTSASGCSHGTTRRPPTPATPRSCAPHMITQWGTWPLEKIDHMAMQTWITGLSARPGSRVWRRGGRRSTWPRRPSIVRRRPLAAAKVRGRCHSVGHSVAAGSIPVSPTAERPGQRLLSCLPRPARVSRSIPVGQRPQDIAYAPDGRYMYTANVDGDTVSVVDTTANQVTATIPVGDGPTSIVVRPDGTQAYVTTLNSGTIVVLDITAT
ncbi:hypothetical protein [Pseudonocardia yunnanensis]|uniref:YncE family protein n=1 Tax=Pseudonocardia yunnanensis TaxID=58107 RepID=A0ABW4FB73_9PSEU